MYFIKKSIVISFKCFVYDSIESYHIWVFQNNWTALTKVFFICELCKHGGPREPRQANTVELEIFKNLEALEINFLPVHFSGLFSEILAFSLSICVLQCTSIFKLSNKDCFLYSRIFPDEHSSFKCFWCVPNNDPSVIYVIVF